MSSLFNSSVPVLPDFSEPFHLRIKEQHRLKNNIKFGINTVLISHRAMGKTSLINATANFVTPDNLKVARFSALTCRNEADFTHSVNFAVLKTIASQIEKHSEFATESLEFPEKIAQQKGIRFVVCIDEFQQIGKFEDSLTFQKKLRGVWQHHENVCYCLYGSKKSMMEKMFQTNSNPFYRFGDIFYLNKIPREDWIPFIIERFEQTGKTISSELAGKVADLTQCYSAYVQQLAWFLWVQTDKVATQADLDYAVNQLLDSCEPLFIVQTEKLTRMQLNFLRALTDGITNGFSHQEILNEYGFRSSANISRIKEALIDKDLIVPTGIGKIELSDPILGLWLKKRVWVS